MVEHPGQSVEALLREVRLVFVVLLGSRCWRELRSCFAMSSMCLLPSHGQEDGGR